MCLSSGTMPRLPRLWSRWERLQSRPSHIPNMIASSFSLWLAARRIRDPDLPSFGTAILLISRMSLSRSELLEVFLSDKVRLDDDARPCNCEPSLGNARILAGRAFRWEKSIRRLTTPLGNLSKLSHCFL